MGTFFKFQIYLIFFILEGTSLINAADHVLYKNCSRVDFCNKLRNRSSEDKYIASLAEKGDDIISFILKPNDDSDELKLEIISLEKNTFRVKIKETESNRYELQEVLDGDPKSQNLESDGSDDDKTTISSGNNKIVINHSPFSMEFYQNDLQILVINGNRLLFQKDDPAFTFGVSFPQAVRIYGIHEHAESLSLRNTNEMDPYRLRNLPTSNYELNSPMALYGSIPFLYGHGPKATSGFFLHNSAEQWYDLTINNEGTEAYIMVATGALDLFVFQGPTPSDVLVQYLTLTGLPHLPQLWTLGYHQCRWNYVSQIDVKDVVANFDSHNFPMDCIWLDVDYTDGKRYFTWDPEHFSDPAEMLRNLSTTNRKLVAIIDPHVKVDENYFVYTGALENDLFVHNLDGSVFEGECWPGLSSYVDFFNPNASAYYASMYSYKNFIGSTPTLAGIWNDMNEPSVFNDDQEKTMIDDAVHYGNIPHKEVHNIYGLLYTKSTHQGLIARDEGEKRPFILTRAHFAGNQRYAAIWTGDNTADWGYINASYAMCLNANILGIVFCGADIGGFYNDPSEELLQRWYQAGAWLPFYRAHASSNTQRREPYLFSDDVQKVIREALQLRYKHLPVWYTLFYEHIRDKVPVIRPLFYQYPGEEGCFDVDDQLLVGKDILVKAIDQEGVDLVKVYFPGGENEIWIDEVNSVVYKGEGFIDIAVDLNSKLYFYRKGSVIVRKDTIRLSSDDMEQDPHTLYILLDENNEATGTVYLDDKTSFKYRDNLEYNYIKITVENSNNITFSTIDEFANWEQFEFIVDKIVKISTQNLSEHGKTGIAKKIIHERDANGNLLRNLKFDFSNKVNFNLKEL